ncbi:Ferric_reduct-domain-containing protein [Fragilariopsis cylindrus CCMP1102]|uniref:Ferric_reduct-domain-containing protein n=1 Tax=Fragilariopsis cylindrus CCMP1102 TaxID=635003 RepID=A0A1E7FNV1_9STRA|nr:Ferric_reduct-domain-containing protein [Fragilariopsis cylindrus CCMP1102]|eukprot:OEU19816.1 Ferric_reduct-domain-containing protein [Fragilariopsis cylindrus CCMP1102]
MISPSWISKTIVILCLIWLIAFPLLGGGEWGKDMFASWAKKSYFHDKAGVPIIMLTIPILIAGSIASMFATSTTITTTTTTRWDSKVCSFHKRLQQPSSQQSIVLILVIFLPCFVYVVSSMQRKMNTDMSIDMALMKSGNIFGMLAVIVLSWLLIPVSRRGPIGKLFGWDPINVVNYHMWSGRIIILASIVHGLEHTIRYAIQGRDVLISYFFPPIQCWKQPQTYKPVICENTDSNDDGGSCSCYDHFLPLTGLLATLGLIGIGLSSLYKVRRNNYATFAMLHYVLSPLTFVAICIHYNKTILYASGSLLYYISSNFPNWIESILKRRPFSSRSNVKIVAVEKLKSDDSNHLQRPCIALTIEATIATVQKCCPGDYVYLLVPSISQIAHPFTVNRVLGQTQQLRIIFRVTGSFTRALESALFRGSTTTTTTVSYDEEDDDEEVVSKEMENNNLFTEKKNPSRMFLPRLHFEGYYGSRRLFDRILKHDVCIIVAAGIGITPYLSLFSTNNKCATTDGLMIIQGNQFDTKPKNIILHWICRDRSLIEYCRKEYNLDSRSNSSSSSNLQIISDCENYSVRIIIHQTGLGEGTTFESTATAATNERITRTDLDYPDEGVPFELTNFSVSDNLCINLRYFVIFSILSWGGLYFLWKGFLRQGKETYTGRITTPVVVMLYGMVIAILANISFYLHLRRNYRNSWSRMAFNAQGNDNSVENMEFSTVVELSNTNYNGEDTPKVISSSDDSVSSVVPVEQLPVVKFKMLQGRPGIEEILEDLQDGISPALFCCVPENLMKNLNEGVNRTSQSDIMNIPVYQESFIL